MKRSVGRVHEIRLEAGEHTEAYIACPAELVPEAGQYVLASDCDDTDVPLATPLFLAEKSATGFWAAPPIPHIWRVGSPVNLLGPLGHGFELPRQTQRLGLVGLGETISRLMPLVRHPSAAQYSMTLFTDLPLPALPSSIEAYPVASLAHTLDWPDYMVIDLPLPRLPELRELLELPEGRKPGFPAQVLLTTSMPCAGLAKCGACAVRTQRGWKLACEDGPVFDLNDLKW